VIVTSRFVFLHLHKSGGTFVNRFLLTHFPDAVVVGYHLPLTVLPAEFGQRPVFGLVRNPWDYYVSWHAFQQTLARPNVLFLATSDDGRLGFNDTIRNLVRLGEDPARLARVAAGLPTTFANRGINLTRDCIASLAGSPRGFYSWLFERMYGTASRVVVGRMETLRADLRQFLSTQAVPLDPAMNVFLDHQPPLNASEHPARSAMYEPSLAALVGERDRPVIDRFRYQFD
jgi:hypothetical protein